jgi:hypothetical protein
MVEAEEARMNARKEAAKGDAAKAKEHEKKADKKEAKASQ